MERRTLAAMSDETPGSPEIRPRDSNEIPRRVIIFVIAVAAFAVTEIGRSAVLVSGHGDGDGHGRGSGWERGS